MKPIKLNKHQQEILVQSYNVKMQAEKVYKNAIANLQKDVELLSGQKGFENWSLKNGELVLKFPKTHSKKVKEAVAVQNKKKLKSNGKAK